jgi:uncharacterized protein YmfQ (DUF2313 family)
MKKATLLAFIFTFNLCIGQENLDNVNSKATETVINYLNGKNWFERSNYVIKSANTLDMMEERYQETNFERDLKDSTSYLFNLKGAVQANSDPWMKVKGVNNTYRKKISFSYGQNKSQSNVSEYIVRNDNNKFLIDWEASLGLSEMTMASFDSRKKKEYVMMRVFMSIEENYLEKDALPDYFCVRINQEGDAFSVEALISRKSELGLQLLDKLLDGKWHKKIIYVRYVDLLSRKQNDYSKTKENLRLIGFVNSIEFDNWIIENDQVGKPIKLNLEDSNLKIDIKNFESYLKNKSLIDNAPLKLKTLNAAKFDYYQQQVTLYGYIDIDNYYNYSYYGTESSHYSFKLSDNEYDYANIYFKKVNSKNLFDLVSREGKVPVKIIAINKDKQEGNIGHILLEGISFELLK